MASKKVYDLMKAGDWTEVTELLANTAWTSQDLDEKHGVRCRIALSLRLIIQLTWILYNLIVFVQIVSWDHSFSFLY